MSCFKQFIGGFTNYAHDHGSNLSFLQFNNLDSMAIEHFLLDQFVFGPAGNVIGNLFKSIWEG